MKNRIRLISTSDIHGAIYPYSYADHSPQNAGLARVKTTIDELRDENSILIEGGDTIEGSPLTFFHYLKRREEVCPLSKAMRLVGYDYINVGNHDFNEGQDALFTHLSETGAMCITSNFFYKGKAAGPVYAMHEVLGKRVAMIGVTTQHIPHWETKEHLKDTTFTDAFETVKRAVKKLRALPKEKAADYIVVVYHGGFEKDVVTGEPTERDTGENEAYRMCKEIDGIDVMLTGHQHRAYCGKLFQTVYTQSASGGRYVSVVDIDVETGEITPQLVEATAAPDPEILRCAQEEEDACQRWLDTTIGTTEIDLRVTDEFDARLHKSQVVTFLNRVQTVSSGAQLSGAALFLNATGFQKEITMRDLVSTYVFPNTLVVKRVSGKTLRAYLEKCAEFWTIKDGKIAVSERYDFPTPGHYNYDMVDGVEYTIAVANPEGARVTRLSYQGKPVKDDDTFTLVVNNYRASGGGDFDMLQEAETVSEIQTSMVELIAKEIMEHPAISFEPVHNIRVVVSDGEEKP